MDGRGRCMDDIHEQTHRLARPLPSPGPLQLGGRRAPDASERGRRRPGGARAAEGAVNAAGLDQFVIISLPRRSDVHTPHDFIAEQSAPQKISAGQRYTRPAILHLFPGRQSKIGHIGTEIWIPEPTERLQQRSAAQTPGRSPRIRAALSGSSAWTRTTPGQPTSSSVPSPRMVFAGSRSPRPTRPSSRFQTSVPSSTEPSSSRGHPLLERILIAAVGAAMCLYGAAASSAVNNSESARSAFGGSSSVPSSARRWVCARLARGRCSTAPARSHAGTSRGETCPRRPPCRRAASSTQACRAVLQSEEQSLEGPKVECASRHLPALHRERAREYSHSPSSGSRARAWSRAVTARCGTVPGQAGTAQRHPT